MSHDNPFDNAEAADTYAVRRPCRFCGGLTDRLARKEVGMRCVPLLEETRMGTEGKATYRPHR